MQNRLRVLRAERDLTQFDLAKQVSELGTRMTENRCWRIENERNDPSDDEIAALAQVLRVRPDEIFPTLDETSSSAVQR